MQINTEHFLGMTVIAILLSFVSLLFIGCSNNNPQLISVSEDNSGEGLASDDEMMTTSQKIGDNGSLDVSETAGTIYVHICGCVVNPGVYELQSGSRLCDGVEAAGGFTAEAATDYANLAGVMEDGIQYDILSEEEVSALSVSNSDNEETSHYDCEGRLNINLATEEELKLLPGIGEAKAEGILKYRDENGDFSAITDLMNVSGIGQSIFESIEGYITVER